MAKALTAASVEKLKPDPERRLEIPDGLLVGLYLVVQPSGKKSWAARFRVAGKPKKLTLGGFPAVTLEDAREAAREALRQAQKGDDPAAAKQEAKRQAKEAVEADRDNFGTVARQFLDRYAKPKNRSWKETARTLGLIPDPTKPDESDNPKTFVEAPGGIAARWADKRVQDITKRDVIELLDSIVDRGAPVAANRALAAVRKLFNWAASRDVIAASPTAGVKAPAAEVQRDRVLSDLELKAVWLAAEKIGWPFGPIVKALILTGQRRDEVGSMTWRELDTARTLWTIPRERAKNDTAHEVPISKQLAALIETLPQIASDKKFVFTTNGANPVSGWGRAKERLDKEALARLREWAEKRGEDPAEINMADWRLHDLRRTVATGLARLGINLPVIEKLLNHTSGSFGGIVSVYQKHGFADEKRRALETWGSFVTALVTEEAQGNVVPMRAAE